MKIDASIWARSQIDPLIIPSQRMVAWALVAVSLTGTYLQGMEGIWQWDAKIAILSILWQGAMSGLQFIHIKKWKSLWYLLPLMLSAIPSTMGFGRIFGPQISEILISLGIQNPDGISYSIILGISLLIDIIPERILVRH